MTTLAILLGLVLFIAAAAIAVLGVVTGLLVFNGCYGASSPLTEALSTAWIFALWPLSLAATALIPPILLARGRGLRRAAIAFFLGCLASALIWLAFLPLGYLWFC